MPLIKSGGKEAVGKNISELKSSGRPQKQAVAIALDNQRKSKGFAKGGSVDPSSEQMFQNNIADMAANPTGPVGLKKGGSVKPATGGWKRWGQR
jgi:hypothetical protein